MADLPARALCVRLCQLLLLKASYSHLFRTRTNVPTVFTPQQLSQRTHQTKSSLPLSRPPARFPTRNRKALPKARGALHAARGRAAELRRLRRNLRGLRRRRRVRRAAQRVAPGVPGGGAVGLPPAVVPPPRGAWADPGVNPFPLRVANAERRKRAPNWEIHTHGKCTWKVHLGIECTWEMHSGSFNIYSLPEFMNFKLFGKTILVVNIKFGLFRGHPLSK